MQINVTVDWYDFKDDIVDKLKCYLTQTEFAYVTLVTKDNKEIPAHKIILCLGSTFFRGLFSRNPGRPHPLLYGRNQSEYEKAKNVGFLHFIHSFFLTIYIFVVLIKITICFNELEDSHIMSWDS